MRTTQTVVITGSTKGIGFGYAREFVRRDFNVVMSGRTRASVDEAVARLELELPEAAQQLFGLPCETSDIAQVQALWDGAVQHFGRVDIWINNAGFARSGPTLLELTPAEMAVMVRGNLIGSINGCQVAVAGMRSQGGGHIVNTLGGGAKGQVVRGMIAYSTTKRAVRYFTECMRKELKDSGITVTTVSPGVNITPGMLREIRALPPSERDKTIKPLNIVGDRVETTTPWLVEQMLGGQAGGDISWLTGAKLLKRFLLAPFRTRDLLSDLGLQG